MARVLHSIKTSHSIKIACLRDTSLKSKRRSAPSVSSSLWVGVGDLIKGSPVQSSKMDWLKNDWTLLMLVILWDTVVLSSDQPRTKWIFVSPPFFVICGGGLQWRCLPATGLCSGRTQFISSTATVPYPSHPRCSGKEERAGKFDGNYLAVSLYSVDTSDVSKGGWGGGIMVWLNLEGRANQTGPTSQMKLEACTTQISKQSVSQNTETRSQKWGQVRWKNVAWHLIFLLYYDFSPILLS